MPRPAFWSMALEDIPRPDYVDVVAVPLPAGATDDPRVWAETVFAVDASPRWVRLAFAVRQMLVPLIGVPRGGRDVFAVARVQDGEALVSADDRHLDFRAAVAVDAETRLVRMTTVVRLKGWRGRVYFAPVGVVHPVVVQSMLRRACVRLTPR
ncbi:DUF2867 domain-containing protein [Rhodococcus sp. SGAir0479]|uniref:DUF2867 domain-containing protein n=1 Tax=Rhodococcus sp. SGAir0479 TaxID=2567884 RepID=UPI0010CCEA71|nr:DUF2867 domain-containing protein [Rhodococcus sp. SGAir0479]QCQ93648.1 DUF2867 domain-containing protein [Rhodococcus sp. SGAir0479]